MTPSELNGSYSIASRNKFFEINRAIVAQETPPIIGITFFSDVDLSEVEAIRSELAADKPSYTAFVVKAVGLALRDFPHANGRVFRPFPPFFGYRLQRFRDCDIAVACERAGAGMETVAFCDVLRKADRLPLAEITRWLTHLSQATLDSNRQWNSFYRVVRHLPHWLARILVSLPCHFPALWVRFRGAAALVSSPAKYGIDCVGGTWPWPLGFSFGVVKRRVGVKEDRIAVYPSCTLTLTFDRRLMAGGPAARFFRRVVENLEHAKSRLVVDRQETELSRAA